MHKALQAVNDVRVVQKSDDTDLSALWDTHRYPIPGAGRRRQRHSDEWLWKHRDKLPVHLTERILIQDEQALGGSIRKTEENIHRHIL